MAYRIPYVCCLFLVLLFYRFNLISAIFWNFGLSRQIGKITTPGANNTRMEYGKPFLLNVFTFNDLHGYLEENLIQTLIIRRHIVFLVWFIKRAWAACDCTVAVCF